MRLEVLKILLSLSSDEAISADKISEKLGISKHDVNNHLTILIFTEGVEQIEVHGNKLYKVKSLNAA